MSGNWDLMFETKQKLLNKYKRMGSVLATTRIEFRSDLKYHTAATDGKNIYVDPNYFASLTEEERMFLIAHEVLHIMFMHPLRLKDKKTGKLRDIAVWNEACDAYINANLQRDGFVIREGYVNRPEALNYTAEEFYEILLREKEERRKKQEEQGQDGKQQNGDSGQEAQDSNGNGQQIESSENTSQSEQNDSSNTNEDIQESAGATDERAEDNQGTICDDHSLWEEAFKEAQNRASNGEDSSSPNNGSKQEKETEMSDEVAKEEETDIQFGFDEKDWFEEQRKEKRERFKAKKSDTDRKIRGASKDGATIGLGDIGKGTNGIDWKLLIRKAIESNQTVWSQRRSIAENNYAYRLEENESEEEATTEVMIDVSGSVQLDLVKAFLRELKPLLKESALKVGCFNAKFWGMVDIKSERDIDKFTIPRAARGHSAWTEDWDLAVRSFSKDRKVNKIVFTDGWPGPGNMPKDDLKGENVIWLVYGNENFRPCCGKVINIDERQLKQLHLVSRDASIEDASR